MANRVSVDPRLLRWARNRSGTSLADLVKRFPKLPDWEAGTTAPTMRQLDQFAQATYTPIGFLFLTQPPGEVLPIPDFRTLSDKSIAAPSADLLDTIYACEERQEWYRDFAEARGDDAVPLVGSQTVEDQPLAAATEMRETLGFGLARRTEFSTWADALRGLAEHAEDAGIMVMVNGVVDSNKHRKLNPNEFRGFALIDELAPLVFVNGADTKSAQIFTLAHELAHVALGGSAISKPDLAEVNVPGATERWCNEVAAELLVPRASLETEFERHEDLAVELERLARYYKVSTLVLLRRTFDIGRFSPAEYRTAYALELARILELTVERQSGGNFYNTQPVRVSKRFARALIADTIEGRTLYRDAFRLLGFKKASTFEELGHRLGVA